jgi:hypothetical protein
VVVEIFDTCVSTIGCFIPSMLGNAHTQPRLVSELFYFEMPFFVVSGRKDY